MHGIVAKVALLVNCLMAGTNSLALLPLTAIIEFDRRVCLNILLSMTITSLDAASSDVGVSTLGGAHTAGDIVGGIRPARAPLQALLPVTRLKLWVDDVYTISRDCRQVDQNEQKLIIVQRINERLSNPPTLFRGEKFEKMTSQSTAQLTTGVSWQRRLKDNFVSFSPHFFEGREIGRCYRLSGYAINNSSLSYHRASLGFSPTLFGERENTFFLRKRNKKSKMASKWDQRMKRLNGARNDLKIQLDQHKKRKDALDSLYGETPSEELRRRGYCKSIFLFQSLVSYCQFQLTLPSSQLLTTRHEF